MPVRIVAGRGRLPSEDLDACLSGRSNHSLVFRVVAERCLALGEKFADLQGRDIGEVTVTLTPTMDQKVVPERFVNDAIGLNSRAEH